MELRDAYWPKKLALLQKTFPHVSAERYAGCVKSVTEQFYKSGVGILSNHDLQIRNSRYHPPSHIQCPPNAPCSLTLGHDRALKNFPGSAHAHSFQNGNPKKDDRSDLYLM